MSRDQPFVPNAHGWLSEGMRVIYRQGKEYLLVNGYHMAIMLLRRGDVYVPVAAAGGNSRLVTDDGTGRTLWDSDVGYHLFRDYYPECFRGHAGDNFCGSTATATAWSSPTRSNGSKPSVAARRSLPAASRSG